MLYRLLSVNDCTSCWSRLMYKMRPPSNLPSNNDAQLTNYPGNRHLLLIIIGWAVSHGSKYRKSGLPNPNPFFSSTTHGSKTPVPIDTKLGVSNYVGDLTLTSKYGNNWSTWVVTVCDFFSFLHLACRSPRLTDFDDLYVEMRGSVQGSAFWGSRWQHEMFSGWNPPKPQFLCPKGILSQISENSNHNIFKSINRVNIKF